MMRYLVFNGHRYYPEGGWLDYCGATEGVDAAKVLALQPRPYMGSWVDWAHIVDSATSTIVLEWTSGEHHGETRGWRTPDV